VSSVASVHDLAAWLGEDIDNEARAEAILAAASTLVRSRTGRAWVDADGEQLEDVTDNDFELVKTVVVQVAARVWLNPRGLTQETTGPFSTTLAAWASLGLSLTEDEAAMLPVVRDGRPGLWTQATTREDPQSDLPDIYLDVVGSEQIPHVPAGEVNW
jgi:hypothetical protein